MSVGQLCYRPEQAPDAFFFLFFTFVFLSSSPAERSWQVEQQRKELSRLFVFGAQCFKNGMTPDERRTREKILRLGALIDGISRAREHVFGKSFAYRSDV